MESYRTADEGTAGDLVIRTEDFLPLLTEAEFLAMLRSGNATVSDTIELMQNRNGFVDVESSLFSTVMAAAVSEGHITQDRVDELKRGFIRTQR